MRFTPVSTPVTHLTQHMRRSRANLLVLTVACIAAAAQFGCARDAKRSESTSAGETTAATSQTTGAAAASGAAPTVTPIEGELEVGKPAPDFAARAHDGTPVHLSSFRGRPVVVYFYPKDETPGCTKEACAFRDAWDDLEKKKVVLIGVSTDDEASHRAFAKSHRLPFMLVSDPEGSIAKAFGVPLKGGFVGRQSFVIGTDGNVRKIYRTVDVSQHAAEIMRDVGG